MTRIVFLLSLALFVGCSPPMLRGEFSLLSTEDLSPSYDILSEQRLEGKACFNVVKAQMLIGEGVYDQAVRNALEGQPDGTMLVDVNFVDDGSCINVTGLPAKLR